MTVTDSCNGRVSLEQTPQIHQLDLGDIPRSNKEMTEIVDLVTDNRKIAAAAGVSMLLAAIFPRFVNLFIVTCPSCVLAWYLC